MRLYIPAKSHRNMRFMEQVTVPGKSLSLFDATSIIIGIVIGAGIFRTPSIVAANAADEYSVLILWLAGGAISLVGALCYAELTSAYPHSGGDYHYLRRAFGDSPGFLFAWARMTIIQTGSIAMLAFILGDYVSGVFSLGPYSPSLYAALTIILLTGVNLAGIRQGSWIQNGLTVTIIAGLASLVIVGLASASPGINVQAAAIEQKTDVGKALIFVLLTFGGWNEAAYISAEVKDGARNMAKALTLSIAVITGVYLLVNLAFLKGLGIHGMSGTETVASDLARSSLGGYASLFIACLVAVAVLSTMNGTIITGARTNYALGRDFPLFGFMGRWDKRSETPTNSLLLQAGIALALVVLGTGTRSGFEMMVEYTAPVFWFFFFLVGVALFVLRRKEPGVNRPFRVPFYPVLPLLFCAVSIYMFQASLFHTGTGALVGFGVLFSGVPLIMMKNINLDREGKRR